MFIVEGEALKGVGVGWVSEWCKVNPESSE